MDFVGAGLPRSSLVRAIVVVVVMDGSIAMFDCLQLPCSYCELQI